MKLKEKIQIWKRYLEEAPKNIKKYKEWKETVIEEENNYYSKYNNLNLHSNDTKSVIWQNIELSPEEEQYFDWFAKNNRITELVQPVVKYLQEDLKWGEYLTYDIAHLENEDDPNELIRLYTAIFKFTPVPLIEEDMDYFAYVKKFKKIKLFRNISVTGVLILLAGIAGWLALL